MSLSEQVEKCGESCAPLIPRWGMYFACAKPKGHEWCDHEQGGTYFKHGEYIGKQCPHWPCYELTAYIES